MAIDTRDTDAFLTKDHAFLHSYNLGGGGGGGGGDGGDGGDGYGDGGGGGGGVLCLFVLPHLSNDIKISKLV